MPALSAIANSSPARPARPRLALALLAATVALTGCGGSGGGGPTATTATAAHPGASTSPTTSTAEQPKPGAGSGNSGAGSTESGPPASAFHPKPHHDSGGGSAQFTVKGGDNSVQEFGAEASESELEEAAAALHAFLDARAVRNWAAACLYLSQTAKQSFAQLGGGGSGSGAKSCAATLAALSGRVPTATLREAAVADVGSLRTEGGQAFLIYRGAPKGTVYAISIAREDGTWKVASLAGVPLS